MNICAVRTLKERLDYFFVLNTKLEPLPHEPKNDIRFRFANNKTVGMIGDYAECAHCGCLYSENK